ncbi:MAG: TetR/AcrR family transcriptional regulator [Archangium sp.]
MAKPRADSPRKVPTQERAQATVDAILRAAAHILRGQGWDACNTNAVAKRAGVSIGSLYQYFPSKEALLFAIAEDHATRGLEILTKAVLEASARPTNIANTVRHYIRAMIAMHALDPKLHRVLVEQVPRLRGGASVVQRSSQHAATLVRSWLETQQQHFRKVDLDVATWMLVTAVEAIAHLEVLPRPEGFDDDARVEELSRLVLGYLGVKQR